MKKIRLACLLLFSTASAIAQRPRNVANAAGGALPAIVAGPGGSYSLRVDGKPFIILGTQLWNSSAWPFLLDNIWPQVKALHANTVEAPVYWEVTEPVRGEFAFALVDSN